MFCAKCGKKLDEDSVFCPYCGQKIGDPVGESLSGVNEENLAKDIQPGVNEGSFARLAVLLHKNAILALLALSAATIVIVVGIKLIANTSKTKDTLQEDFANADADDNEEEAETKEELEAEEESDTALEIKEEESVQETAASILQQYLDNVLAPQYGYADLTARSLTLNPSSYADYNQFYDQLGQYDAWTQVGGIAEAGICDLDGDGEDELMVTFVDAQNAGVSVYEAAGSDVVKKAEIFEERCSDLNGYGTVWAMVEANGKKYLLWRNANWAVLADGYQENIRMWQYNGEKIGVTLEILQTAGGSAEFEYTAYQYDESGQLLLEEIIYREYVDEEGRPYPEDSNYRMKRMKELFGGYGIQERDNAFMYAVNGKLDASASSDGKCQPLLVLDMQAEYQGEEIVFYFNP